MTTSRYEDDPRLTAYALGELDAEERTALENELEESPEARGEVEAIRNLAARLKAELGQGDGAGLSPEQRSAVEAEAAAAQTPVSETAQPPDRKSRRVGAWIAGLLALAASVALAAFWLPELWRGDRPLAHQYTSAPSAGDGASESRGDYAYTKRWSETGDHSPASDPIAGRGLDEQSERESGEKYDRSGPGRDRSQPDGESGGDPERAPTADAPSTPTGARHGQGQAGPPARPGESGEPNARPTAAPEPTSEQTAPPPGAQPPGNVPPADPQSTTTPTEPAPDPEPTSPAPGGQTPPANDPADDPAAGFTPRPDSNASESYDDIVENEFLSPLRDPLSTFSIDVDTASYANVRRFLKHGQLPPRAAVRIEELVNYFHYDYPQPEGPDPFSVNVEAGVCPWDTDHRLAVVGLKGKEIAQDERPPSNLVFLIDVSGSMRDANKLPLVKRSLKLLVENMTEDDRIAIVTYASQARMVLDSTGGNHREKILEQIDNLQAGGSTNGEGGIQMAYQVAVQNFYEAGTNRVLLCTDGDFNVGVSSDDELVRLIREKAQSGVFLSVFGFGMGNLKDSKLEKLADKGNGHYGYVDSLDEARKSFVEELTGTLYTIAKDVKIQVEFNPGKVGAYRLIGYENRALAAEDFADDKKDAGEIGAGHTVTAVYELIPPDKLPAQDDSNGQGRLRYQRPAANVSDSDELFTVALRYKQPQEDKSLLIEAPVSDSTEATELSLDFDWAATVACFGMILRDSKHKGAADYELLLELALGAKGPDPSGRRREFIDLMYAARAIKARQQGLAPPAPPRLSAEDAQTKATVQGKYSQLLKKIAVPDDLANYGAFSDYGFFSGSSYAGHENLPEGHWVYVYPDWYIWGQAE